MEPAWNIIDLISLVRQVGIKGHPVTKSQAVLDCWSLTRCRNSSAFLNHLLPYSLRWRVFQPGEPDMLEFPLVDQY